MIHEKNVKFQFNTDVSNAETIQSEINDLKAILLSVALKLDEAARAQLVKELSRIPSKPIKQWVSNLDAIGKI